MKKRQRIELEAAQRLALAGKAEQALPAIEKSLESGFYSSAVTVAEIYAFQRRWRDCYRAARHYLLNPRECGAPGNFYTECVQLVATSCMEETDLVNDALQIIGPAKESAIVSMSALETTPQLERFMSKQGVSGEKLAGLLTGAANWGISRLHRSIDDLESFLVGGNYESVFYRFDSKLSHPELIPAENCVLNPCQITRLFSMNSGDRQILLELKNRFGYSCALSEDVIRDIAKAYIDLRQDDLAWEAIVALVSSWRPINYAMVLPSILVTDPAIRGFMNKDRLKLVMDMPKC